MELKERILQADSLTRGPNEIDGDIYVRLGRQNLSWRAVIFLAMFTLAAGDLALGAYAQLSAVAGSGKYSKGTTQCPGMTPAQRAAAAAKH